MGEIRSFEDLDCWKSGRELRVMVSEIIKQFPPEEKYRLVDQLKRSSRSVTNNIAEGYGRFHFKENAQFCRLSRGSLYEVKDHMIVASDEKYIDDKVLSDVTVKIETSLAILNGYINYLKRMSENK